MDYFIITNSVGTEETGNVYPQTDGIEGEKTFSNDNSFHVFNHHGFPSHFENSDIIKIHHTSKLTDFISSAIITAHGFIVNERVKQIFESFSIINHRFYNIKIKYRNIINTDYYWFHMYWENALSFIDYEKSVFEIKRFSDSFGEIEIESESDLIFKKGQLRPKMITPKKLVLRNPGKDIFYSPTGIEVIISEVVLDKLEKEKITGFETRKLEIIEII